LGARLGLFSLRRGLHRRPLERFHFEAPQLTAPQDVDGDTSPDTFAIEQADEIVNTGHPTHSGDDHPCSNQPIDGHGLCLPIWRLSHSLHGN
jgi:hypothetical protein